MFDKPKILLIDLDESCYETLKEAGFNVSRGTFGNSYRASGGPHKVRFSDYLPNRTEQEIVVVDLTRSRRTEDFTELDPYYSIEGMFATAQDGEINPRPYVAFQSRNDFDRILRSGGVFVVFTGRRTSFQYNLGSKVIEHDEWEFLSVLDESKFPTEGFDGCEFFPAQNSEEFKSILSYFADSSIETVLRPYSNLSERVKKIAYNKFYGCIAALYQPAGSRGNVLLLPNIRDKGDLPSRWSPNS